MYAQFAAGARWESEHTRNSALVLMPEQSIRETESFVLPTGHTGMIDTSKVGGDL